jgi:hypothetical protein
MPRKTVKTGAKSCRLEILDRVIPLHQEHLRRLIRQYLTTTTSAAMVISDARLGGLHHRYNWREAAYRAGFDRAEAAWESVVEEQST